MSELWNKRMDMHERAAIAARLPDHELMRRTTAVAGPDIGDPLHDNRDSVALRERFGLTVEHNACTTWAFNDTVAACWSNRFRACDDAARRAAVIAVAALYV
jgi:hypothetical protein